MSSAILREIAELSNPAPVDFDPEDIQPDYEDSDDDVREDADAGREHYAQVRLLRPFDETLTRTARVD
jgi:protein AATF/BFR2